jgi:cobalt-zinc-cadmium efflux system outer membrane protein
MGNRWGALVGLLLVSRVGAEPQCRGAIDAAAAARCALSHSPEVAAARLGLRALAQQRQSAGRWLPSHPLLTFSLAERRGPASSLGTEGAAALNWYFTFSQELEIAGQRGKRLAVLDAEAGAQLRRLAALEQETAAAALTAYGEVLAARDELALAERAAEVAAALSRYSSARAAQELVPQVESDLARAEAARLLLLRGEAAQRVRNASAQLQVLLEPLRMPGGSEAKDGSKDSAADALMTAIVPLPGAQLEEVLPPAGEEKLASSEDDEGAVRSLVTQALRLRADLAVAQEEVRIREAQWALLRRARVPNLGLSFTAQSDGFSERVLGGGLSLPLPLPEPIGPSRAGEIAAAATAVAQAQIGVVQRERQVELEVRRAHAAVQAARHSLAGVPAELIGRAQTDLWAIAEAIRGGRVALREALLWQRGLLELLQLHLRARRELALSRIELRRALGLPLLAVRPAGAWSATQEGAPQ